MELFLSGFSYRYECENLCRLFFPYSPVKVEPWDQPGPPSPGEGPWAWAVIEGGPGAYSYQVTVSDGERALTRQAGAPALEEYSMTDLLYNAFVELTGNHPAWGMLTGIHPVKLLRQYVEERLQKFTHQEQLARKEREEERKQQERFQKIQQKVEHQLNTISRQDPHGSRLLKKKMKAVKSLEHRFEREREDMTEFPDSEEAILVGFGENTAIPAGKTVLDFTLPALYAGEASQGQPPLAENLRLYVRGGEHVCVIGRNGAGKTTLLRRIAGELLKRTDLRAAYMPQDYGETVDQSQTPVEFLAKSWEKEELTRVKTYLGSMKYTPEEQEHTIQELSGGQKAKLFFLKMILDGANVLVLDEPTRNFSPLSGPVIRGILEEFPGCILSVSHDRKYIGQVCDTVYQLEPQGLVPVENQWR